MPICLKCEEKFDNKIKIDGKTHNMQNRKYCLNCSPFKSHNTKNLHKPAENENTLLLCHRCNETKPKKEFYIRRTSNASPYCKKCSCIQVLNRQRAFKRQCIDYKGGKCLLCGYSKSIVALDFHHVDPSKKDFSISKSKLWSFDDLIKSELDKCNLLCKNCHAEEHNRLWEEKWRARRESNSQP